MENLDYHTKKRKIPPAAFWFSYFVSLQSGIKISAFVDLWEVFLFPRMFFPSSQAEALVGCCQERQIQLGAEKKRNFFLFIQLSPKNLLPLQVNENGFFVYNLIFK